MPLANWNRAGARVPEWTDDLLVHADALYNVARRVTDDPGAAEDLVEDAVARALRAGDELAPNANVRVWLFRALRSAFDARCRGELRHPGCAQYDTTGPPPDETSGARSSHAELGPVTRVSFGDVERALRMLADEARWAILLDLEGFTDSEAAAVMGCAVTTAKARLSHARAALRVELAAASHVAAR